MRGVPLLLLLAATLAAGCAAEMEATAQDLRVGGEGIRVAVEHGDDASFALEHDALAPAPARLDAVVEPRDASGVMLHVIVEDALGAEIMRETVEVPAGIAGEAARMDVLVPAEEKLVVRVRAVEGAAEVFLIATPHEDST